MIFIKLALREILNSKRFALFFVLNLTLGLMGFVALDAFKNSLESSIMRGSKERLGGDLNITSRRALTEIEKKQIKDVMGAKAHESQFLEFYSMVASSKGSRLVELRVVDRFFPFYGKFQLRSKGTLRAGMNKEINGRPIAWVYPELLTQLNVSIGDTIKIGQGEFRIGDVVEEDLSFSWRGASLAPRIYIGKEHIDSTGLVSKGSTITYHKLYQLIRDEDLSDVITQLKSRLIDGGIYVNSHISASEQTGRLLNYLSDYLGLVSVVSLFLSLLGAGYLFRGYLMQKTREIAILISLGVVHRQAILTYLVQVCFLGLLGAIPALLLGFIFLPLLTKVIQGLASIEVIPVISGQTVIVTLLIGMFGGVLACLPVTLRIFQLKVSELFQENSRPQFKWSWLSFFGMFPLMTFLWGLSVWLSHSLKVGTFFSFVLLVASLLLVLLGSFILWFLENRKSILYFPVFIRLALRSLFRYKLSTVSCFLVMALGVLLMCLVPQLRESLQKEVEHPKGSVLPSLFLFDIQDNQITNLRQFIESKGAELKNASPMIRAKLEAVNGKPFERTLNEEAVTREEETEQRFRNRGFNLTYRDRLSESEEMLAGRDFSGPFDWESGKLAEVSIEYRFADRLGLRLGDVLKFNVQGVPIEGKIINLRKVRWTTFQPNFFVQFQTGVLSEAPKTWVVAISELSQEKKLQLQDQIVEEFPNVSIVDVTRVVTKILEVSGQMSGALSLMAILVLLAGIIVLFSIAYYQINHRLWDLNMMKILGASIPQIRATLLLEFGLLSFCAGIAGSLLSIGLSWSLTHLIFDGIWAPEWKIPVFVTGSVVIISVIVADIATRNALKKSPILLLS